jgi:hypothetical protein
VLGPRVREARNTANDQVRRADPTRFETPGQMLQGVLGCRHPER